MARYYDGGRIPWVKSGELRETIITDTEEHVTGEAVNETGLKMVPSGALLLAMYGATIGRLGTLGVSATTNQAVCHIVPDPKMADVRYLFHALSVQVPSLVGRGMGGAQPNISQTLVKGLAVSLPPLEEQHRIADILDRADALRAKRRAVLARLDNLVLSTFLEWLGPDDPARRQPLSTAFSEPPTYGTMIPPSDRGSWLTLRVGNIQDARLDLRDKKYISLPTSARPRHSVRDGDLLMARAIASQSHLGKCIVAQPGGDAWAFDSHLMRIRLNQEVLMPEFFRQWLLTPGGRVAFLSVTRRSSVQFNVNTKEIAGLRVPMPPIADQRRFVRFEGETEGIRTALEASLTQLDALFASLQHRAFRGEL